MLRKIPVAALALIICLACAVPGWAQTGRNSRETLRGIKGVGLVVNGLSPEAEKDGLDRDVLQVDIEERLRQGGLKVFSRAEGARAPGQPHLLVRVIDQKRSDMELYSISIAVYLVQTVRLSRDSKMVCPAETWDLTGVVSVGAKELAGVRRLVLEYVDMFVVAWREANHSLAGPAIISAPGSNAAASPAADPEAPPAAEGQADPGEPAASPVSPAPEKQEAQ